MSYRYEKDTGDLIIDGWETGIAPSPLKGTANIQGGNISSEVGEVMCSFIRSLQSQVNSTATGTITPVDSSHLTIALPNGVQQNAGVWINVSASTITGLSTGDYYILSNANSGTSAQISSYYNGAITSGLGLTGTASYTLKKNMSQPIASANEIYGDGTTTPQYRYYVLDNAGLVWVYDTGTADTTKLLSWFLPDISVGYFSGNVPSGIAVLNGWLLVFAANNIYCKSTVRLAATSSSVSTLYVSFTGSVLLNKNAPHFAFVGHQGRCYYTDQNYIGSIFPDTSLLTGANNVQSFSSYTAATSTGTFGTMISGSTPTTGVAIGGTGFSRIPAVFFTSQAGVQPTNLTLGTIYYIQHSPGTNTFEVYAALTGGSAIDIAAGASGTQYYNTFYPISTDATSTHATVTVTAERVGLPTFEIAQTMTEIGNTIIIGCLGNIVYPWNQIDTLPSTLIALPENRVYSMVTVNQMAYIFAGNKGNVYITDGNTASLVIKIPDYCAGVPGTPASYIEPYFTWGGSMYLRGRVYFSILDQTSAKAGNCGGIWSFVPTQNLYIGQDTGIALRLENQNSYGTYSGVATVLIPFQTQLGLGPQYFSGWYSSTSSATYGIDFTGTTPSVLVVETDLIPIGTMLLPTTDAQIEYKLSAPRDSSGSVAMKYRLSATDAWSSMNTSNINSTTSVSGYFTSNFQNAQWLQLQATITSNSTSASSFMRLKEIRVRQ